jgi:hypothetical protein
LFVCRRHKSDSDNTNLTGGSITDLEAAVNLENLRKWLIANKLSLNVAKTEFMLIGSKQKISDSHPNVVIENNLINKLNKFMKSMQNSWSNS